MELRAQQERTYSDQGNWIIRAYRFKKKMIGLIRVVQTHINNNNHHHHDINNVLAVVNNKYVY